MADIGDIRARLEMLTEELADAAFDLLREASALSREAGEDAASATARASAEERRLTRARRAVERAVAILSDRADTDDL